MRRQAKTSNCFGNGLETVQVQSHPNVAEAQPMTALTIDYWVFLIDVVADDWAGIAGVGRTLTLRPWYKKKKAFRMLTMS